MLISIDQNRAILFIKSYLKFCNLTANFLMGKHRKFRGNLSKIQMRSQKGFRSHMMWQFFFRSQPTYSLRNLRVIYRIGSLHNTYLYFVQQMIFFWKFANLGSHNGFQFFISCKELLCTAKKKNYIETRAELQSNLF